MTKRILALFLAALMLVPMLAACGEDKPSTDTTASNDTSDVTPEDTTTAEDTTTEEVTTAFTIDESGFLTDGLETIDFDGALFRVAADKKARDHLYTEETSADVVVAQLYEARVNVETRFHATIYYESVPNSEIENFIQQLVAVADNTYHVAISDEREVYRMREAGNALNFANFTAFDFSDPWWTGTLQEFAVGDLYRIGASYLTYGCLSGANILIVNKDVANEYQVEIPYEKVFNGDWYLDDLIGMVKKVSNDVNGDGVYDANDVYGWAMQTWHTGMGLMTCFDIKGVVKDEENLPAVAELGTLTEKCTIMVEKLKPLEPAYFVYTEDDGKMVYNGQALLALDSMDNIRKRTAQSDINYGFLLVPKFDEHQEDYIVSSGEQPWIIPMSCGGDEDLALFIGSMIEAIQCQFYNRIIPAYTNTIMKFRMAESPDDSKILSMVPDRLVLNMDYTMMFGIAGLCRQTEPGTVASFVKQQHKLMTTKLKTIIRNNQKMEG